MDDGSSSEDSLTGTSRGHKRKLETIIEDDGDENESNLDMPSSKFKKGEEVPSPMMLLILMLNLMNLFGTVIIKSPRYRGQYISYPSKQLLSKPCDKEAMECLCGHNRLVPDNILMVIFTNFSFVIDTRQTIAQPRKGSDKPLNLQEKVLCQHCSGGSLDQIL